MVIDKSLDDCIQDRLAERGLLTSPTLASLLGSPSDSPRAELMAASPFGHASGSGDTSGKPTPAPATPAPPATLSIADYIVRMAVNAGISLSGKLTPEARAFLSQHGICFYCRRGVHRVSDCAKRLAAKSNGKRKLADDLPADAALIQEFKMAVRAQQRQQQ